MFWIKILRDVLGVFKAGASGHQIAGGFVLGFAIGLTPGWPLHVLILCVITFLLSVNLSIAGVAATLAVALAWILDPVLDSVGYMLLKETNALQGLWTTM
ncbi:MAG: DUF2062 domain-containing protein, partial [Gammaproteobacteria bacterium]|nr:DUF2062 domain-containing protein [Gammaproteobacteria bacterium]